MKEADNEDNLAPSSHKVEHDPDATPDPTSDADATPDPDATALNTPLTTEPQATPWHLRPIVLILAGLLAVVALAYSIGPGGFLSEAWRTSPPPPTQPTPHALVGGTSPSAFLAAMPTTVGRFTLTRADVIEAVEASPNSRAAEIIDLTYQADGVAVRLRAFQYVQEADARRHYAALAAKGSDPKPLTVGSTPVGERVTIEGDSAWFVWRNTGAVFILAGPASEREEFWNQFPF